MPPYRVWLLSPKGTSWLASNCSETADYEKASRFKGCRKAEDAAERWMDRGADRYYQVLDDGEKPGEWK